MKVLQGNIDQNDPKFQRAGQQCCAMAVTAACKSSFIAVESWTNETINACVIEGNHLFNLSYEQYAKDVENFNKLEANKRKKTLQRYLHPTEILTDIAFGDRFRVKFETFSETEELHGMLLQESYCENTITYGLLQGISLIFQLTNTVIFTTCSYSMCIMKFTDKFWAFDSHKRGTNGLSDNENGKAVLIEFHSIEELVNYYKKLFSYRNEPYDLIPIKIHNSLLAMPNTLNGCQTEASTNDINTLNEAANKNDRGQTCKSNQLTKWKQIKAKRKKNLANVMSSIRNKKSTKINDLQSISLSAYSVNTFAALDENQITVESDTCTSNSSNELNCIHFTRSKRVQNTIKNTRTSKSQYDQNRMKLKYNTDIHYKQSHLESVKEKLKSDQHYREKNLAGVKRHLETNPNYKKKNLESSKRRLKTNPDYKRKNLEIVKRRLENNPDYKRKNLETIKKHLENNPDFKRKNLDSVKKRLETDQEYHRNNLQRSIAREQLLLTNTEGKERKRKRDAAVKYNSSFQKKSSREIRETYKRKVKEGPTHVCCCCGQLFFQQSVVLENDLSIIIQEKTKMFCIYRPPNLRGPYEICKTCLLYVKSDKTPSLSMINGFQFEEIPDELKDLSPLEERLISARIPFMQIRELGIDKQRGLKGNCVNVPVDINDTVTQLPRLNSDQDTVVVQLMRRMSDKHPYIYENVRPEIVFRAAQYLISTDLYKNHNITLNSDWINQYKNSQKHHHFELENITESVTDETLNNATVEEEAIEQQETLLTSAFIADQGIKMAPGEGNKPISILGDTDLDALAFPTIFAGKVRKFKVKVTPSQIAKAHARMHDRRVATNMPCLMLNFCKARVYKLVSRVNIALRKKRITPNFKVSDVLNNNILNSLIQDNEGYRIVAVDRASPAFWEKKKKTVLAMLRQYGPATLFLTFSSAETKWAALLVILTKTLFNKEITEEQAALLSWQEKVDLIKKDPITCARYFDHRFNAFWTLLNEKNGPIAPFQVSHYYIRYEIQFRGSIHAHIMVWIDGAPEFKIDDPTSFASCEQFIDKLITCKRDESLEVVNRQFHAHKKTCRKKSKGNSTCRFAFPRAPMRRTQILLPLLDKEQSDAKKFKSLFKDITEKSDIIAKTNPKYSFDEYLMALNIDEPTYILSLRSQLKRPTVFLQRNVNERFINGYNTEMLELWEANMDIQFILDPYACVMYIINYINKSQNGMSRLLREVASEIKKGNEPLAKQLRSIINAFLNNSEISAQEIALHLLSIPMSKCSVGEVFINTSLPEERSRMLKSKAQLELLNDNDSQSTDIVAKNVIDRYIQRPDILETLCLADFAAMYNVKSIANRCIEHEQSEDSNENLSDHECTESTVKKLVMKDKSGYLLKRTKRKLIRYRKYNEAEDPQNFYRENLMLYTHWREEPAMTTNLKEQYLNSLEEIHTNRKQYCKNETFEINLDEIIENYEINTDTESDSEEHRIKDLAVYEINDQQFDINVELPNTRINDIHSNTFTLKNLLPETDFLNMIRKLNKQQRKYLLNLVHIVKTDPTKNFYHFISGGAGVGKSYLIKAIDQSLNRYWRHRPENKPDDQFILFCAPTGKAAFPMGGVTIHSAFHLGFNLQKSNIKSKRLNADIRNTLNCHYKSLKLIIIDEISMVGSNMFWAINNALQEILGNNLLFGGISLIVLGDFNQLPPVHDTWIFQPGFDPINKIIGPYLWRQFQFYELTEMMRQKDDAEFAIALNNLAVGNTTDKDDELFESREITTLKDIDANEVASKAVGLFWTNHSVDLYNEAFLSNMDTEKHVSQARDVCNGNANEVYKQKLIQRIQMKHHKETQCLPTTLRLHINARYVVTSNVDTSDGITNGASGILKQVTYGETSEKEKVLLRVYLDFKNKSIGAKARNKLLAKMRQHKINLEWTPIERVQRVITVSEGSPLTITRSQFPLIPGQARTIHSSQGSTEDNIIVDVNSLNRRLLYTALSRATSASGLYILGQYKKPCKPDLKKDKVMVEMNRLRNEVNLNFTLLFPEDCDLNELALFHNVRSLNLHFEDIQNNSFLICNILLFVETWLKPDDNIEIDGYTCIHRRDCQGDKRYSFGTIAYVKTANMHMTAVFFENCNKTNSGYIDIVGLKNNDIGIIFLYKSPKRSFENLREILDMALKEAEDACIEKLIIVGDFNIDYLKPTPEKYALEEYMIVNSFEVCIQNEIPSTDNGSLIDLCFANYNTAKSYLYESIVSDHKPIWINL